MCVPYLSDPYIVILFIHDVLPGLYLTNVFNLNQFGNFMNLVILPSKAQPITISIL